MQNDDSAKLTLRVKKLSDSCFLLSDSLLYNPSLTCCRSAFGSARYSDWEIVTVLPSSLS